ncbi:MAG: PA2169 family four-helix-bundle protein [Bacteroidota bacterium]
MKTKKVIKSLHDLIQINREGENGYKEASENVKSEDFKTILYRLSQQRALFRGELEEILRNDYRDAADVQDSAASKIHRFWMEIKTAFNSNDDEAILAECARGEEHAIEEYTKMMDGRLPAYIENVAKQQLDLIRGSLSQIKGLASETEDA